MHSFHIIGKPKLDLGILLQIAYEGTGKRLAEHADSSNTVFTEDKKVASCLSTLFGREPSSLEPMVLSHLHFTGLLVCEELDYVELVSSTGKLSVSGTPSRRGGLFISVISGSLNEWRDMVVSGLRQSATQPICESIYRAFIAAGYAPVWAGYREVSPIGGGFLLEFKR